MDGRAFNKRPSLDAIFTRFRCECGFEGHRHLFCKEGVLGVEGSCPACKKPVDIGLMENGIEQNRVVGTSG